MFAGHYEADGRLDYLEEVANQGFRLRVFGPDYPASVMAPNLKALLPIQPVRGDEYSKALCGGKVALAFLSKLNRDTYTRRSFEIPATGTLMLSEYSDDLASLYEERVEADFFRSKEELVRKLRLYLGDPARRASVAEAGRRRVLADGHDVVTRMKQVLAWAAELQRTSPKEPRLA